MESLKWSMGIGFVPVHYYVVNQMLLMLGDLEHSVKEYDFRILDYFALQMAAILDQDKDFDAIMQQTELNYEDKMQVMQDLSANIAHEMRTPLSRVRASMDGIESYLPLLIQTYRKQLSENPEAVQAIREDHLNVLEKTPERIALMVDQANSVIDMLLMNLRDNTVDKSQYSIYFAADLILQALDRYPFKHGEREKLSVHIEHDFYFRGLDNLFIFVIFNLLKNALFSINSALKGHITIELKPGNGVNRIIFRDTGEGMDSEVSGGYSTDSLPREPMVPVLVWHFADAPFVVSMAIYPALQSLGSLLNSLLIYQLPESVFLLINANGVFPGSGNCFR